MSERNLASIQEITSIDPIPNADKIELARVLGWDVVVRKGEFRVGHTCVYVQIDSVLPEEPWCEFMRDRKFRVRTIKLRKQISQGIVFPISILHGKVKNQSVGDDVSEVLNVVQYVPPQMRVKPKYVAKHGRKLTIWQKIKNIFYVSIQRRRRAKIAFPTRLVPKTHETRIQNSPSILRGYGGDLCNMTEKVDGMSMTCILYKGKWKLYTRNWRVDAKMHGENAKYYTKAFENEHLKIKCINLLGNYAIQGEIIGPGIDGSGKPTNKYNRKQVEMYAFNVYDIDAQEYLGYFDFKIFCKRYHIRTVPQLGISRLPDNIDDMLELCKDKSLINPSMEREGLVVRSKECVGRWQYSFKCINPKFLLKLKD